VSAIEAAVAVIAVEEGRKQRISPDAKGPFFGKYDLWMYNAVLDDRLCDDCLGYEKTPRYFGAELIGKFPYLQIVNDNKILAKVHPHCRCTLNRVTVWSPDDIKWFIVYGGT